MGKKTEKAEKIAKSVVKVAGYVATIGGAIITAIGNSKK